MHHHNHYHHHHLHLCASQLGNPHNFGNDCCTDKINVSTGQVLSLAGTSARRAVSFASASDHLKDGLWGWEDHCGHWFDHAIDFKVPILKGIQLWILQSNGCLCPNPCLHMGSQNVLLQSSRCWRELVTFCPVFAEEVRS